ncbi:hypothetical protein OKW30_000900 [Paraburkholderia sp. Clong3]|nr:hypothetical protein [Paraburkholderia sp. CI2]
MRSICKQTLVYAAALAHTGALHQSRVGKTGRAGVPSVVAHELTLRANPGRLRKYGKMRPQSD